jgi:hypothetical protein
LTHGDSISGDPLMRRLPSRTRPSGR